MTGVDRMTIARLIAELTASQEGRAYLEQAGYKSEMPIIIAGFDDSVGATLDRIRARGDSGLVATAEDLEDLLIAVIERQSAPETRSHAEVSRHSTIGLLLRASKACGDAFKFKLTDMKVSAKSPLPIPEYA